MNFLFASTILYISFYLVRPSFLLLRSSGRFCPFIHLCVVFVYLCARPVHSSFFSVKFTDFFICFIQRQAHRHKKTATHNTRVLLMSISSGIDLSYQPSNRLGLENNELFFCLLFLSLCITSPSCLLLQFLFHVSIALPSIHAYTLQLNIPALSLHECVQR